MPGLPITEVRVRLGQIHQSVCAAPIPAGEHASIRVTCSLGVVCVDGENPSVEYVISQADTALYRAKAFGRNRIEYADSVSGRAS